MEVAPVIRIAAPASRAFLRPAVRYLADDAGIRQFLDIGTGLPTAGNTHEIAQAVAPECRVVYVDNDPVVLVHARARLTAAVVPGSYLAIMHPASDLDPALLEAGQRWNQLAAQPVWLRSPRGHDRFLTGLELVEPGLVTVPEWASTWHCLPAGAAHVSRR
jgi:hypothetical protein